MAFAQITKATSGHLFITSHQRSVSRPRAVFLFEELTPVKTRPSVMMKFSEWSGVFFLPYQTMHQQLAGVSCI